MADDGDMHSIESHTATVPTFKTLFNSHVQKESHSVARKACNSMSSTAPLVNLVASVWVGFEWYLQTVIKVC